MGLMSYLYNKYIEWSSFYRNREGNQYESTLYPVLDPLPSEVIVNKPELLVVPKKSYRDVLLNNIRNVPSK